MATYMLVFNNAKNMHFITMYLTKKADWSESGSVLYPRNTKYAFKGQFGETGLVNKVFGDSLDRDNINLVIETVSQLPFVKDDIITDDNGKEYLVVDKRFLIDQAQTKWLKSSSASKKWFIGVQGDE